MSAPKGNSFSSRRTMTPLERFLSFCRHEPETDCVIWIGGQTKGRGHHVPYGSFWFEGESWFAHRWAARYIHGQDIEGFHTDHCCPNIPIPNTLCVAHTQSLTPRQNRELQTERRRNFVHLQVGIVTHRDLYGYDLEADQPCDFVPFYNPPVWLTGATHEHLHHVVDPGAACPF